MPDLKHPNLGKWTSKVDAMFHSRANNKKAVAYDYMMILNGMLIQKRVVGKNFLFNEDN